MAIRKYANYRQITGPDGHLANCREFVGNTMRATIVDEFYYVWSWRECIAFYRHDNKMWYVNERYWSRTTTKQQNFCRAWLAFNFERVIGGEIYPPQIGWHPLAVRASRRRRPTWARPDRQSVIAKEAQQEIDAWEQILHGVKASTKEYNG